MKFNLTIFQSDQQPGLMLGFDSPKQRARGREDDLLLVFLSLKYFFDSDYFFKTEFLDIDGAFFKTSGSVTKAIREFVDGLNRSFLQKNHRFDQPESWQTASLSLGVIHQDTLFLAQVGASQVLVLSNGKIEPFFDETLDQRGLGVAGDQPSLLSVSFKGDEIIVFRLKKRRFRRLSLLVGEPSIGKPGFRNPQWNWLWQKMIASLDTFQFVSLLPLTKNNLILKWRRNRRSGARASCTGGRTGNNSHWTKPVRIFLVRLCSIRNQSRMNRNKRKLEMHLWK